MNDQHHGCKTSVLHDTLVKLNSGWNKKAQKSRKTDWLFHQPIALVNECRTTARNPFRASNKAAYYHNYLLIYCCY